MSTRDRDPARNAVLALALEVSSDPKPGNVDRGHDHDDTTMHHFLTGAIDSLDVFEDLKKEKTGIGETFKKGVRLSQRHSGGNTHFGALLLLTPLVRGAYLCSGQVSREDARDVTQKTDIKDAVAFYEAFNFAEVYVEPLGEEDVSLGEGDVQDEYNKTPDKLDVTDENASDAVIQEEMSLYEVMEMSATIDDVAREWVNGFERCFEGGKYLKRYYEKYGDTNDAIVLTYARLLAEKPDTFVAKKHGEERARKVSTRAEKAVKKVAEKQELDFEPLHKLDADLVEKKVNPGTTADIVAGSIFVALEKCWIEV